MIIISDIIHQFLLIIVVILLTVIKVDTINKKCVRRCCNQNEILVMKTTQLATCNTTSEPINITNELHTVLPSLDINLFDIMPVSNENVCNKTNQTVYKIFIRSNLNLNNDGELLWDNKRYSYDQYCAANIDNNLAAFICIQPDSSKSKIVNYIALLGASDFYCTKTKICIRKCCRQNETVFIDNKQYKTECKKSFQSNIRFETHPFFNHKNIYPVYNRNCNETIHHSFYADVINDAIKFVENGSVFVNSHDSLYAPDEYCFDNFDGRAGILICIDKDAITDDDNTHLMCGMIISMPFLLMTFLIYTILPDKNINQKALMFYVLTLLFAYVLLIVINLAATRLGTFFCSTFAYGSIFFFMASFIWMNVICIDIWYTFSGGRGFIGNNKTKEKKRFVLYSIYAWCVPLVHILFIFIMDKLLPENSIHKPNVGIKKCFIDDGWPNLWYFYGQASILVTVNAAFFITTAIYILRVKRETSVLKKNERHTYEKDKQRFNLYLKLLLAMGVNWITEIISWLVNWQTNEEYKYIWYVTDFINAMYGVFIFFLFVFKKKVWKMLQKRYYIFIGKPNLARTMITTAPTTTSNCSSSTVETNLSERNAKKNGNEMALREIS